MKTAKALLAWFVFGLPLVGGLFAQGLTPALQEKINAQLEKAATYAANPAVVEAVKAQNAKLPAEVADLTQDKWKALTVLDPIVRGLTKNTAGQYLRSLRSDVVSEAFVSDADGRKVAFIAKTTNWSHKGKAKHDDPMKGQTWVGPIEVDESSGQQQIQIAVPVLDGGKPIGSLVVGLSISGLAK